MSMPSDVTEDVTEAMDRLSPDRHDAHHDGLSRDLTPEQLGLIAAAVVAFLGIGVLGPKLVELRRRKVPNLKGKAQRTARDVRSRAQAAGTQAKRRMRQLGGGTIRR